MSVETESIVTFSTAAIAKVRSLIAEENANLKLRVYVEGGGCSGLQYGFRFESDPADDDFVIESGGVTVLVDSVSSQYLNGAKIDFTCDLEGERFQVDNPSATTTCGCKSSFST
jgi:iron-sulfur cluster insertion protein